MHLFHISGYLNFFTNIDVTVLMHRKIDEEHAFVVKSTEHTQSAVQQMSQIPLLVSDTKKYLAKKSDPHTKVVNVICLLRFFQKIHIPRVV